MNSSLYKCTVFHKRFSPAVHAFTSSLFMWHLDLDEIDELCRRIPILSRNRFNFYTFRDNDHFSLGLPTLRENVVAYLKREGVDTEPGRITLLTSLRTFGYVFNPVSFYFCHDQTGAPLAIIAEVQNTFGERKLFLMTEQTEGQRFRQEFPKEFYISPFSELDHRLQIRAVLPDKRLALYVDNYRNGEERPFFRSSLTGARTNLSLSSLLWFSLRFPLVTLKIIALIHWHALRLYLKKVPFHRKSANRHLQRGIFSNAHTPVDDPVR